MVPEGVLERVGASIEQRRLAKEIRWPPKEGVTTVDDLLDAARHRGLEVDRPIVVELLQKLADGGVGSFKNGRRGWPSRLEWDLAALNVSNGSGPQEDATMLRHSFRLRPNTVVEVELPRDLKDTEAERLADFIRTLPF